MSTCISREGEYSDHETTEGNYICDRCGVLDEDGLFAERDALRVDVERLNKARTIDAALYRSAEGDVSEHLATLGRVAALIEQWESLETAKEFEEDSAAGIRWTPRHYFAAQLRNALDAPKDTTADKEARQ